MAASPRSTATSSPSPSTRRGKRRSWTVLCSGREACMPHYIAIIEDAGPDEAVGLCFPDRPGCFSGGDDVDEALENAPEALAFYAQELIADGRQLPPPRTLDELKADPDLADKLGKHTVALIEWPPADPRAPRPNGPPPPPRSEDCSPHWSDSRQFRSEQPLTTANFPVSDAAMV